MSNVKLPRQRSGLKHLAREVVMPVYLVFERLRQTLMDGPKGRYPIVHHGIQRSGTNFLCSVLEAGDYKVLNKIDPRQDNLRHKHARWQVDKSTIAMDARYVTSHTAEHIDQVNALCGYQSDQKHVVLFREPRSWINAIYRWGLDNGWFASTEAFWEKSLHEAYLEEWHSYYAAWEMMALSSPDQVLLVSFEDLRADPTFTLERINAFMGVMPSEQVDLSGGISKVRHSAPISQKRVGLQDKRIDDVVARDGQFHWKKFSGARA